jgi:NCAIR mutase (PurE)-related protein
MNHLRRCSSEYIEKNSALQEIEQRTINMQGMKDEIEKMMERITIDIRNIDIEKGIVRAKSPDVFFTSQKKREDNLAKSALKETIKKKSKIITSAIGDSFKGRISPKMKNPKVLLRANTLINYQV